MRITTRIRLSAVLAVIIATTAGIVLLVGLRSVEVAMVRGSQATQALTHVFELSMLTTDYLANHEPRAERQWQDQHEELSLLLRDLDVSGAEELATVARTEESLAQAQQIFLEITAVHAEAHAGTVDQAVSAEYEARLTSRLLVVLQSMVSDVVMLEDHATAGARRAQQMTLVVVMLVSAAGVLVMSIVGVLADRAIIKPLETLRHSASRVGRGNLDVRTGIESTDEVGEFAASFDSMVASLKASYEMLENEIAERRRAERALSEYRDHLEQMVHERTRELIAVNEDLQRATHAKDDFLASMSHELRTPLNSVIGFTDLILKGRTGDLTDEQKRQLRMVHEAGQQLLGLVNEILELSRLDAGALIISAAAFDPAEAASRLVEMMMPVAERKDIVLSCRAEESAPAEIVSDRGRVDQIMLNLLGNAIKFTECGRVDVTVRSDGDGHVVFDVNDTGIGIPAGELDAIFEHFHQIPAGPTAAAGTGLGLSISRRLAEALGGGITVVSEVGVGSIFTLWLPLALPDAEAATMTLAPERGD